MEYDPCRLVSETNISDRAIQAMSLSELDGNERGFLILEGGSEFYMTEIVKGTSNSVEIEIPTRFGIFPRKVIGAIHTHPNERHESLFSPTDIREMFDNGLEFSVALFDEGGKVLADVFTPSQFSSFDDLKEEVGDEDFIRRANKALIECTQTLGEVRC